MAAGVNMIERQSWWSDDLPLDIINLIANSLYYTDQVSFRAVCKSWRAAHTVRHVDKLPWLIGYDSEEVCYLYDPSRKRKYIALNMATTATASQEMFTRVRVFDSKHDWVLLEGNRKGITGGKVLFFYNPFTDHRKKMIELPVFHKPIFHVTFTTTPNSPDCVIFALSHEDGRNRIINRIITCRPGDIKWNEFHRFEGKWANNFVYVDGFLFFSFLSPRGVGSSFIPPRVFGALNTKKSEKWCTLPHPPSHNYGERYRLIESDGNILLCYYVKHAAAAAAADTYHVWKLNPSEMNWIKADSLDDGVLFITWFSCIWVPMEKGSELANTIHFIGKTSQDSSSYRIRNGEFSKYGLEIHDYEDWKILDTRRFWIRPPQTRQ